MYTDQQKIVFLLFMFLLVIFVSYITRSKPAESFVSVPATLQDPTKIDVYFGHTIPDVLGGGNRTQYDNDPSKPSVTGKPGGPYSLFEFAFNKSSPECCSHSSYSTSGGCVCITKGQIKNK
jgi:hypothetical protein